MTSVTPPGGVATTTNYSGTTVTVTRGGTVSTSTLDGLGRPLGTTVDPGYLSPVMHSRTAYDAAGRATYQSDLLPES